MKCRFLYTKNLPISFSIILLLFHVSTLVLGDGNEQYKNCGNLFNCGNITGIDYPFWGSDRPQECGFPGLKLECENDTTVIEIKRQKYRVLGVKQDEQVLRITRMDISTNICQAKSTNTTLDTELFDYAPDYRNLTLLYGCPAFILPVPYQFECPVKGTSDKNGYVVVGTDQSPETCHTAIVVPISSDSFGKLQNFPTLIDLLGEGFEVQCRVDMSACRKCRNSGGRCGDDLGSNKFTCLCPDQSPPGSATCSDKISLAGNTTEPSPARMGSSRSGMYYGSPIALKEIRIIPHKF